MTAGITGHQDLGDEASVAWVRSQILHAVEHYVVTRGYTCLAVGADQLFAEILAERHIPYVAVIPCHQYLSTFASKSDANAFLRLLDLAETRLQLAFAEPSEHAFSEAGKRVVDSSDVVIAAWDGQPAKGLGGTADIVTYASAQRKRVLHLNPAERTTVELN